MNVTFSTNRKFKTILANTLSIFAILVIAVPVAIVAYTGSSSPFIGQWQGTDPDGSDTRLIIAGHRNGPFQITWTESYRGFCNGEAGTIRGTGWLNETDPELLEADLYLECPTTGATLNFRSMWRYHPVTNTLSSRNSSSFVTIWQQPGRLLPPPSALVLRINYGHDRVESFYEDGHMAWITITENDGMTVKATAELITEPKDYWGGQTGFQSLDSVWLDAEGNSMQNPPDIRPYDWVFGWVDNGASVQVQIGDISGMIDLPTDSIKGTITASWITDPVQVECLDWSLGGEPFENKDGGLVLPNGNGSYSCSWAGQWDIQPGQAVGVGYFSPDGHWVANAFLSNVTIIVTSTEDVLANDGVCTLREAIVAANINAHSGNMNGECPAGMNSGTDTILLASDQRYSLTIDSTNEDRAADGDLDIWNNSAATDLIIRVEGSGRAIISQNASIDDRVLDNRGATVRIEGLTLTGGGNVGTGGGVLNSGTMDISASEVSGNFSDWVGGGIFNSNVGTLILNSSTISGNTASSDGGGVMNEGSLTIRNGVISNNLSYHDGGGIANNGTLIIDASTLSANAGHGGGGLANLPGGTATIEKSSVIGGNPNAGQVAGQGNEGGGVINFGELVVLDSQISGNSAEYAGGLANWGGVIKLSNTIISDNSAFASAGGIHNKDRGTITIENGSVISGNTATWDGGGINNRDGTVTLSNGTVSGNSTVQSGGGILNLAAGTITVDASTISGNSASDGGGLANWSGTVTLTNSTVSGNTAAWGGGLVTYGGVLAFDGSTVSGNAADNDAGGIFIKELAVVNVRNASFISDNTASNGGGISNWSGTLTIDASTISSNTSANSGGGLLNKDSGTTNIQNGSTVYGNTANWGGGISNWDGTLTITDSTVSGNTANSMGGGLENIDMLMITMSVLLDNTSPGDGDAIYSATGIPNATMVTNSCVVGNGSTAVFNQRSASQSFIGNWWGNASGPSGAASGSGDSVSGYIDFASWLVEPPSMCAP